MASTLNIGDLALQLETERRLLAGMSVNAINKHTNILEYGHFNFKSKLKIVEEHLEKKDENLNYIAMKGNHTKLRTEINFFTKIRTQRDAL